MTERLELEGVVSNRWAMNSRNRNTLITALVAAVIIGGFVTADVLHPFTGAMDSAGQFYPLIPIGVEVAIVLIARFVIFNKREAQHGKLVELEREVLEVNPLELPSAELCDPKKVLIIPRNIVDDGMFEKNPIFKFVNEKVGEVPKDAYVLAIHGKKRLLIFRDSSGALWRTDIARKEGGLYKFSESPIRAFVKAGDLKSQVGPLG